MNTFLQAQRLIRSSKNVSTITKRTLCYYSKKLQFSSPTILRVTASPSLACSRNFWETFPIYSNAVHLKDGLDKENHQLIYRCKLFNYAFYAQLGSMCTLAGQLIFGLYKCYQSVFHDAVPQSHFGGFSVTYDLISFAILGLFTVHNIAIYYLSQRMLLRVYHRPSTDEYILVSLNSNPFRSRLMYCKPGDLKPLFRKQLLAILGNFKVKDRSYYVKFDQFINIMHFNRLLSEPVECD